MKEDVFVIDGGESLNGRVQVCGAKNAVLPMLAASVLTPEPVTVRGCPQITDVADMTEVLRALGERAERNGRDITVEVRSVNNRYLDCSVKMPRAYIFAEDAVTSAVQQSVSRGKVDVFITVESLGAEESVVSANEPLARG